MGMRDECQNILRQEQQAKQQAEKTEEYYRKLLTNSPISSSRHAKMGNVTSKALYKRTLLSDIPPELQQVFQEFIQACPDRAWDSVPVKADPSKAWSAWRYRKLEYGYGWGQQYIHWYLKFRLSDGSIHGAEYVPVNLTKCYGEEYRLITPGFLGLLKGGEGAQMRALKEKVEALVLKEAQEILDNLHSPSLYGSQEFIKLTHYSSYGSGSSLVLFRDGAVFEPDGRCNMLTWGRDELYQFLLETLTKIERGN